MSFCSGTVVEAQNAKEALLEVVGKGCPLPLFVIDRVYNKSLLESSWR